MSLILNGFPAKCEHNGHGFEKTVTNPLIWGMAGAKLGVIVVIIRVRVIGETSVRVIQSHTVSHGTLMPRWVKIDTRVGLQWDSADLRAGASFKSIKQPFLLIKMLSRGHSNLWSPHTWNILESGMPLFWWKWPNFQNTNNQVSNGHIYMVQVKSILTLALAQEPMFRSRGPNSH